MTWRRVFTKGTSAGRCGICSPVRQKAVERTAHQRDDGSVTLDSLRKRQYAVATTALEDNPNVAGSDGLFDIALTNGLLEIAAAAIPGHPAATAVGRMPPASRVLSDLVDRFGHDQGFTTIETDEDERDFSTPMFTPNGKKVEVRINVAQLRDALARTQAARHGRGPADTLTSTDVEALSALDNHPALRVTAQHRRDLDWTKGRSADEDELERAAEFIVMMSDEDIAARVDAVRFEHGWSLDSPELQECPVCGNDTLISLGTDDWGYGIVAGTCGVCSYRQSEHAAEEASMEMEWATRWAHE